MGMIRKALLSDLPIVLSIIQYGREKMIASGNSHQWGSTHPSDEQIKTDIEKGNSYLVLSDDGSPIATFAFIQGTDPTYLKIEGEGWLNNEPYGTIHRIAIEEIRFYLLWYNIFGERRPTIGIPKNH